MLELEILRLTAFSALEWRGGRPCMGSFTRSASLEREAVSASATRSIGLRPPREGMKQELLAGRMRFVKMGLA